MNEELARRIGVMVSLVERAPGKKLGRTAIMKLLYFLATLRNLRLGYRFSLYSYGPFDSDVLQDLDYAKSLDALVSRVIGYPRGYGYEIEPGPLSTAAKGLTTTFLDEHDEDLAWVIAEFGNLSASDLELASTIVYADREGGAANVQGLAQRVRDIKPHFSLPTIESSIERLISKGMLESIN
jgi:hypothetical protein